MITCRKCRKEQNEDQFKARTTGRPTKFCLTCRTRQDNYSDKYHGGQYMNYRRPRNYLLTYGITEEQFLQMSAAREDKCDICGQRSNRRLHVDHCHKTKVVRGLLCLQCNTGLGLFKDDPANLIRASNYLIGSLCDSP